MRKPLKPRDINPDELIATAIDDPQAMGDRLYRETDSPAIRRRLSKNPCLPGGVFLQERASGYPGNRPDRRSFSVPSRTDAVQTRPYFTARGDTWQMISMNLMILSNPLAGDMFTELENCLPH
jgi:hypothetical protein